MPELANIEKSAALPALIDRAVHALSNARTAAEVLEARDMAAVAYDVAKLTARIAKAKGAHDALIAAAHRAQADALEIEAGAKRRLADEYDAAQSPEAQKGGRPKTVPDGNGFTAASAGLSRKAIHEARVIRDAERADPGVVRRTLDEAIEAGEEPTRAKVRRAVKAKHKRHPKPVPSVMTESQHERDLRMLLGVWHASCESARAEFWQRISMNEEHLNG